MQIPFKEQFPQVHPTVFIAPGAVVSGDVTIEEGSSVWYNAVIRGDVNTTRIGKGTNIQDNSTLHQSPAFPLILEDEVTVGHNCILHSCTVKKGALIGMGSIVLDGAVVGEGAFIGAGSLVPGGKIIPPGMLAFGRPAKVVRALTNEDLIDMARIQREYAEKAALYKAVHEQQSV
ncbi:MAG: gamma carbonic anhydrase [Bacilli bacterium]